MEGSKKVIQNLGGEHLGLKGRWANDIKLEVEEIGY
jgi:hypothetical protein